MQNKLNRLFLMLIFAAFAVSSWAAVTDYTFTGSLVSYTEITDGTLLPMPVPYVANPVFNAIPLGFTFVYDGINYQSISVAENGFLAMGDVVVTNNLPISSSTGTNNVVAALSRDIQPQPTGSIMYLLTGTAPNRVFTVQWKNFRRVPTTAETDMLNFQIQLHESTNNVVFAYGGFVVGNSPTAANVQVGLRGANVDDFNNRTTLTDWTDTDAGTAANQSCRLLPDVFPPNGYLFTFAPVQQGNPPMAAQNPIPANAAINVNPNAILSWMSGGGAPTGYKVFLGTNNPPTNMVNGATQTGTTYQPSSALSFSTQYFWQIVPFNEDGDAPDCPIWSFTTWANPTVTSYPYLEGFDAVIPPALPLGWATINANSDAYTWESIADPTANTPTNAMRIRYNTSIAMNDWLISPPLQVTGEYIYKISFYYRANTAGYPEKLGLYMGSAPTVAAMTNQLWINSNITNTTYQMAEVLVPMTATGTIYLGFHGHSAANQFYLFLDSVKIEEMTELLVPPTNLAASVNGNDVHLTWEGPEVPVTNFSDDFESYANFSLSFDPWTLVDVDGSTTYGFQGTTFTNSGVPMAYIIFNPTATVPPLTGADAHSGSKYAASFASVTPMNNDWMISPMVDVAAGYSVNFWAKSYTAQYGLERFKVGVSTGGTAPADFTIISGANYIQAPIDWTNYNYDLSAYAGQQIRVAIQCVSNDAFIFFVDDFSIDSAPASFSAPVVTTGSQATVARSIVSPNPGHVPTPVNRDLLGYKIYRDGALIGTVAGNTLAYDDMDLAIGSYTYTVTANYDGGESVPAGPVSVNIIDLLPPLDLSATVELNDVTLNWTSPIPPLVGEWLSWSNNDLIDNSVGTNGAAVFDVAHLFDSTDLAEHQGSAVAQVKFVPAFANCVYTIKVWTGGTATTPGSLVYSSVAQNVIVGEWNTHILTAPVAVPTDRLWVGYEANTQGGYPAGCDSGPQIEGKGNIMNFGGWTTLSQLAPTLTYNWQIQTFVATNATLKNIAPKVIAESPKSIPTGTLSLGKVPASRGNRALVGYKVYRDGEQIATISDPGITTYTDNNLVNGDYLYGVTAHYSEGESSPATVNVTVFLELAPVVFEDSFETYPDFALAMAPWTLLDQDNSPTYGFSNITFPNSEAAMAYIVFNPSATVPPITDMPAHSGSKMAASFAAVNGPNSDWMFTPRISLGDNSSLKFWAKSHTAQYGLERFRVGVSTAPAIYPQLFTYITGTSHVNAPTAWTEFFYDLSAYDNQSVFIGIRCVSDDAFVFYVDDFTVHSGPSSNDDNIVPVVKTELKGNYPNPFNPQTTIRYSVKDNTPVNIEIYNLKGQLVKRLVNAEKAAGEHSVVWNGTDDNNRAVSSGVYFFKMKAGKYSSSKKMILMK